MCAKKKDEGMSGNAVNVNTGAVRAVKLSTATMKKILMNGVDKCSGSCKCTVEPDGHCPNGWPSRSLAVGYV